MSLILSGTDGLSDVDGSAATPAIRGTDSNTGMFFPAADTIAFSEGGVEAMRLDSAGNVGIGTSSPNSAGVNRALTISGSSNSILELNAGSTRCGYMFATTAATIFSAVQASSIMQFNTVDTERMRIDSSGNLLVGTTSKVSNGLISVLFSPSTSEGTAYRISSGTNATYVAFQNASSTQIGFISGNGSNITYSTSSDYRLKENIAPMTGALAKVALLKPCTYTWKVDGSSGQGFIAHELQEIVPDCVVGEKDAVDAEGNPKYQGIDTSFLVATLTAAIQELNAKVEAQAAEIALLKSR